MTLSLDEPKTKEIVHLLNALDIADKKVLILTKETDMTLQISRNLKNVHVLEANKPTTYEIMNADIIVISK